MDDLTNKQKYLLTSLYKEYLNLQPGLSEKEANYFQNSDVVRDEFLPDDSYDYVSDICWNLKTKGYINCYPGDDLANDISLTDKTIIYFENRFSKAISSIIDFISKIKP